MVEDIMQKKWYQLSVAEVFQFLQTSATGLAATEAKSRLVQYGYNVLEFKKRSSLVRFLLHLHNPLIYILLAAAVMTALLNEWSDTVVILGCVILNVIIGFIQEGKGESAIEALRKMMVSECTVLRDGVKQVIPARELVPGDVVILNSGDRVSADIRLFYTKSMEVEEAALTGESLPTHKHIEPIPTPSIPPADQRCIAFSGTFVTRGSGQGVVVATGEQTEFGMIAKLMKETEEVATPLMRKIAGFTRFLMVAILSLAAVNFIIGIAFKYSAVYSFQASVALAVAAIPEMLPAILAAILALAMVAMARRNALIRKLPAAETLGCTTVICSDKTGTLTKNQMTVLRVYAGGKNYRVTGTGYAPAGDFLLNDTVIEPASAHEPLLATLRAGLMCNDTVLQEVNGEYTVAGDPTEAALLVAAKKAGITEKLVRVDEIPFESERQYMATLHQATATENIIYVKGSPEKVLSMCQNQMNNETVVPLQQEPILAATQDMAQNALRVLGMAYKMVSAGQKTIAPEDITDLVFLGLQGLIDPPREEAIAAVATCKKAGIRTVMITGDHAQTAKVIAKQLGIGLTESTVITGSDLNRMDNKQLYEIVDTVSVYARVAPEHKLRIATQLQQRGHIVAMTGDGVN
ncbi:MAG: HAD-IC family P-type ATPase, partial [bacterium]|nr:HAD-IC family P-type ATPase [bacterium]